MSNKLKIDHRFDYYDVAGEAVSFVCERGVKTFPGAHWIPLLEHLTGAFGLEQILARLDGQIPPDKLRLMIRLLQQQGIVVEAGGDDAPMPAHGQWTGTTNDASQALLRVALVAIGETDATLARQILALAGIQCDDDADLAVVLTDDYLRPELHEINRNRLAGQQPWLLAKIDGERAWIGALFVPGQGPCWECFAARWNDRNQTRRYLSRVANGGALIVPPLPATPATRLAGLASIPVIVERFARTGAAGVAINTIWTLGFDDGDWQRHTIVRRPQCPACGNPKLGIPTATMLLQDRPETTMVDGAHRAGDLLQTWEQFEHHISPVTGVVDAFAPVCCDDLAHCYESTRYDTKPLGKPLDLLSTRDHTDWGKGIDPMQARVSALAETLERYSLMAERPADTTRAAMIELGAEAIDPRSLLHFSDAQYADHGASSSDVPHFERVPRDRFDPDQVIGWTAGRCLTDQRVCLVPSDYCWISPEATRDGAFCVPDTNGCAAGSHLEHAILQGLYELVERDSVALWWYNMARRPGVDLASFHDPEITAIRGHHRSPLGRELRVLDITSDIGIPVFAAISASAEVGRPEFVFGFGCHQNPAIALRGAVTELIQLLTVQKRFLTTPTNPDPWKNNRPLVARYIEDWLRRTRREDQPHLFPAEDEQPRSRADFQETCTRDLRQDLSWCVDRLHSLGIKVFVVDVTRPDIGLAVVRVMAPGLRHFWRRLGPGRLYDAPVALGWLDHPTAEHELNPISMFV